MPASYPLATPIDWLTSVAKHADFSRDYADRHVYRLDDRPGFFRHVPANAKRTLELHNDGAVLAVIAKGAQQKMVEMVPFVELMGVFREMSEQAKAKADAALGNPLDEPNGYEAITGPETKADPEVAGTAMDNLPQI